jgi:hypothetical protein
MLAQRVLLSLLRLLGFLVALPVALVALVVYALLWLLLLPLRLVGVAADSLLALVRLPLSLPRRALGR